MRAVSLWLWQERLKGRWQGSPVQAFFQAWGRELLASLPAVVRRGLQPRHPPRHCPWPLPTAMSAYAPGERVVLDLSADQVLARRLSLPLAAARDLSQVVQFELDRFTPFTRDQVHYVIRREGVDADHVWVTLALVRRDWLADCLQRCSEAGLVLDGIEVLDAQGQPTGLNLLPSADQPTVQAQGRHVLLGLALLCAVLLLALPLVWLHNRQDALATMQAQVQTLRQQAGEVAALRKSLDDAQGAAQFLGKRRLAQPARALLLSELSHCLPPDTWLQSLEVRADGQVDLAGFSARASALIGQIKGCPHLAEAQYQGVIQPDEASGRDRFYMRAQARGEAGDAAHTDGP